MNFVGTSIFFLVLYVDSILLVDNYINSLRVTKIFLTKNFEMKDFGNASFVLAIQIHQDHSHNIFMLS